MCCQVRAVFTEMDERLATRITVFSVWCLEPAKVRTVDARHRFQADCARCGGAKYALGSEQGHMRVVGHCTESSVCRYELRDSRRAVLASDRRD